MNNLPSPAQQRAYLLGLASDADTNAVEEATFGDGTFHESLRALESELVEAYVTGTLEPSERAAFERRLADDGRLQTSVEVQQSLTKIAAHVPVRSAPETADRPAGPWHLAWFRPAWGLAFAAALGAVVVVRGLNSPTEDPFRAKGGSRASFRARCLPDCRIGAQLSFELAAPADRPYFAAFGRRPDGRIVWYEPAPNGETTRRASQASNIPGAPRSASAGFWPKTFRLTAPHRVGPHEVFAVFAPTPQSRAEVAATVGDDLEGSPGITLLRRRIDIKEAR